MLKFATKLAPQQDRLQKAHDAGFRHAEIFLTSKLIKKWKLVAATLENYDINYELHFANRAPLSRRKLKQSIKLYHRLNCESMVIHQPMFRKYGKQLLEIDSSVCLAVENHRLNPDNFWRWAETHEWLTLDVEHLWKHTLRQAPLSVLLFTLDELLTAHGSQVRRVHLPGYEPGSMEHRPASSNPKLSRKVFTALSEIGYQGLIVSEARPSMQKPKFLKKDIVMYEKWERKRLQKLRKKQ